MKFSTVFGACLGNSVHLSFPMEVSKIASGSAPGGRAASLAAAGLAAVVLAAAVPGFLAAGLAVVFVAGLVGGSAMPPVWAEATRVETANSAEPRTSFLNIFVLYLRAKPEFNIALRRG